MKKIYIFKTGHAFEETLPLTGDFEQMVIRQAGLSAHQVEVIDATKAANLPAFRDCAGVIITGSHAMVTDNLDWSLALEAWIREAKDAATPLLGICYGHQLIAKALGGRVDYHPQGIEIGSVSVKLHESARQNDALFGALPPAFSAHVTHSQSVRQLPPEAIALAYNDFEGHHAFRVGECIWGVQFHPEFSPPVMHLYLDKQQQAIARSGQDFEGLKAAVTETPHATQVLKSFAQLALG